MSVVERFRGKTIALNLARPFFVCTLICVAAVYLVLLQTPAAGTFHDDGLYLVTAKALAEGQGYRIISLPGEPPQTKYPILFPWVLSLVWRAVPSFPANLPWLRLVPLLATLAWLCLSWPLLRRLGASKIQAGAIVLLTAISPWVAFLSTALMSETLFALLLTAGLLMMTRACQEDGTRIDPLIAGFLFGAAVLTRIAGIAPAAAAVAVFLATRRWISAAQCLLGSAVVIAPWFWWVSHHQPAAAMDAYYSASNYASWNIVTSYAWPEKLSVLLMNAARWRSGLHGNLGSACSCGASAARWSSRVDARVLWPVAHTPRTSCDRDARLLRDSRRLGLATIAVRRTRYPAASVVGIRRRREIAAFSDVLWLLCSSLRLDFSCGRPLCRHAREGVVSPVSNAENWDDTERLLNWISRETPADATLTGTSTRCTTCSPAGKPCELSAPTLTCSSTMQVARTGEPAWERLTISGTGCSR